MRNNPIDVYEYDFRHGQIRAFIRRTHRSYADVPGSRILAVPSGTWISDDIEGQNKKSLTQYRQISGWLSFSLYESTTNEPLQARTFSDMVFNPEYVVFPKIGGYFYF
ncbi:MAG: hypothetical protein IPK58_22625 [Acidobacteria bacterium]|nr:hypothetical protein [Acidobacteriota bacterium]